MGVREPKFRYLQILGIFQRTSIYTLQYLITLIFQGFPPRYCTMFIELIFVSLKVVGNEKRGGSGSKLLLEYSFGPWRSMSV